MRFVVVAEWREKIPSEYDTRFVELRVENIVLSLEDDIRAGLGVENM